MLFTTYCAAWLGCHCVGVSPCSLPGCASAAYRNSKAWMMKIVAIASPAARAFRCGIRRASRSLLKPAIASTMPRKSASWITVPMANDHL